MRGALLRVALVLVVSVAEIEEKRGATVQFSSHCFTAAILMHCCDCLYRSRAARRHGEPSRAGGVPARLDSTARRRLGDRAPPGGALPVHGDRALRDDERHVRGVRAVGGPPAEIVR
jgi:hypothetical protein